MSLVFHIVLIYSLLFGLFVRWSGATVKNSPQRVLVLYRGPFDQDFNTTSDLKYSELITQTTLPHFSSPRPLRSMSSLQNINLKQGLKLVLYYFLLYFFTVVYNVANKKVLGSFPLPVTVSALQTLLGIPLFLPLWLAKFPSNIFKVDWKVYNKIAACHGFGNLATVVALETGSISFLHVVKSAEPIFSAVLSIIFLNSKLSIAAYVSLIPIVVGVALASAKEMSFNWTCFGAAMISNLLYQSRMVFSKKSFASESEYPLSASNTFRLITILSFLQLLPVAIFLESNQLRASWTHLMLHPAEANFVMINLIISGVSFYIYNEVSFWILDIVHPVTHAVGNTVKRIVLILVSILLYHTTVNSTGMMGAALAVAGSFAYALVQNQSSSGSGHAVVSGSHNSSSSNGKLSGMLTAT